MLTTDIVLLMQAMENHGIMYCHHGELVLRRGPPMVVVPPSQQQPMPSFTSPSVPAPSVTDTSDICACGCSKRFEHDASGFCISAKACDPEICSGERRTDRSPFPDALPTPAALASLRSSVE